MHRFNRRNVLQAAAAAALAGSCAQGQEKKAPVNAAIVGCGWFGNEHLKAALADGAVNVVALCDVDTAHLEKTADSVGPAGQRRPKLFKDYRDCLAMPGLQAVFIATPPHWHALPFIAACRAGLDIYCEKPLAYDIREGQAMVDAAREAGNIVQIGFQRRRSEAIRAVRDRIRNGTPGRVIQVDARIHYSAGRMDRTPTDPPDSLDWDFWCGPAPKLPYSPAVGHIHWRLEKEYGHGHLVDWGIHLIDATRFILDESMPRRIVAAGGLYELGDHITTPDTLTVHFEFDKCPVVWRHRIWGAAEYRPEVNNGIFLFCEKETLFVTDTKWMIIPRGKGKEPVVTEARESADCVPANVAEFLAAVRSRKQPGVSPADAARSTTTVQLAMIACETGTPVLWNDSEHEIPDNPAAAALLKREYRKPWKHPYNA